MNSLNDVERSDNTNTKENIAMDKLPEAEAAVLEKNENAEIPPDESAAAAPAETENTGTGSAEGESASAAEAGAEASLGEADGLPEVLKSIEEDDSNLAPLAEVLADDGSSEPKRTKQVIKLEPEADKEAEEAEAQTDSEADKGAKKKNAKRGKNKEARKAREAAEEELPPLPEPVLDVGELFSFKLDRFQIEAINAIDAGKSTVVCAPTGSGKTVIAEYAIRRALKNGKRCFYTTPLKALSNQKYSDLRAVYGDKMVGLLTGDISVNRNAYIVVMTTEVYRNMLYGTVLGDVRSNLTYVDSVIVDECHFMNDPDRGTVWEELVIYSPAKMQLIALSATIANAADLCAWMNKVHGPTALVQSSYRPVPLFMNYFIGNNIYPIFNKGVRVNNKLRLKVEEAKIKKKLARKNRGSDYLRSKEEAENERRAVYSAAVKAMDEKDMLPAIYFLFSRKRCDEAAKLCVNAVKLSAGHKKALNEAINEAVREHPSLADCQQLEHIRRGVAAHHAGLLPILKGLVENLFQQGLIKVVFATETLAAGINMPARTTVISAIVKNSDEGLRGMYASEFLQMSGRAGRRGMDEVGNVVVIHSDHEDLNEVVELIKSPADPLVSRFTPGYGMVLNLLQVHSRDEARALVERSFGQFVIEHNKGEYADLYEDAQKEINKCSSLNCDDQKIGDVQVWKDLRGKLDNINRVINALKSSQADDAESLKSLALYAEERDAVFAKMEKMHCNVCAYRTRCAKLYKALLKAEKRKSEIEKAIEYSRTSYWRQFAAMEGVLTEVGYLVEHKPTWEGELAGSLRSENILFLAEIILSGVLEGLEPEAFAGVVSSLVMGDARAEMERPLSPSEAAENVIRKICAIAGDIDALQKRYDVHTPVMINTTFSGLVEFWCYGTSWSDVRDRLGDDEGDLIRVMRRTLDLMRQFAHAPHVSTRLAALCEEAERLLDRDEVHEAVLWTD